MTSEEAGLIGEFIKAANSWAIKIFGPTAEQIGGLLGDYAEHFRRTVTINRMKGAILIDKKLSEENVLIRPLEEINPKIVGPILEGISLEEDETLRELWANMFINYIDSKKNLNLIVYPGILKQLSTNEVKVLIYMDKAKDQKLDLRKYPKPLDYEIEEITNLERLNLIKEDLMYKVTKTPIRGNGEPYEVTDVESLATDVMKLTGFGSNFLDACRR
ncbi:Abi-alpha family protein [Dyadobacter frigoris]|uniref:DUF4393 domain-containing protein n=1 Tax=Dyadobacter frigoris TaxID=2576211 RepID=A0A4U6CMI6_9BACT|nr:Abi-alpha family protein [Dyadobacter frigoris]TKT85246.1 DUF4393 domain-containing protein [Dyadobacter frigoris]